MTSHQPRLCRGFLLTAVLLSTPPCIDAGLIHAGVYTLDGLQLEAAVSVGLSTVRWEAGQGLAVPSHHPARYIGHPTGHCIRTARLRRVCLEPRAVAAVAYC